MFGNKRKKNSFSGFNFEYFNFKKLIKKYFKKTYLCIPTEQLGFSLQKAKNLLASSPF